MLYKTVVGWTDSLQNLYVEALTSKMTVFGNKAFKEETKVKWGRKGGSLIQHDWHPCEKRERYHGWTCMEKGHVRTQQEDCQLQAKERCLRRN